MAQIELGPQGLPGGVSTIASNGWGKSTSPDLYLGCVLPLRSPTVPTDEASAGGIDLDDFAGWSNVAT